MEPIQFRKCLYPQLQPCGGLLVAALAQARSVNIDLRLYLFRMLWPPDEARDPDEASDEEHLQHEGIISSKLYLSNYFRGLR